MVRQALTDLAIRKLVADDNRVEIWDAKIPGFGVRASTSGTKSFILMYRFRGKPRRLTLGRYPTLSLSDARQRASEVLRSVQLGVDPDRGDGVTPAPHGFGEVVTSFVAQHCQRHNRPRTAHETERILRTSFCPSWGSRDIREITKSDVHEILDRMVAKGKPSAANHALAAVRKLFAWAVDRDIIASNPCADIQRPAKVQARENVLDAQQVVRVVAAASAMPYPFGPLVRLLVLTAQRRNEVANMRWTHIDFKQATWTIPAALTKSNRTHCLPLSKPALDVLRSVPRIHDEFVFPSGGAEGRVFSGFSKAKRRLDQQSHVTGWTLHDLRRTAATELARIGTSPHVVERILNHTTGVLGGVAGIYNRFSYAPEMRDALEAWGKHVVDAVGVSRQ